jgi:hypothetical protein
VRRAENLAICFTCLNEEPFVAEVTRVLNFVQSASEILGKTSGVRFAHKTGKKS